MSKETERLASVGTIQLCVLKDWANGSQRFQNVMAEESRFQEAVIELQKQVRERGVPENFIEDLNFDEFGETIKENFLVVYVRAAAEGFFLRKTEEEIESETLSNPEWLSNAMEQAVEWIANAIVKGANKYAVIGFFMNFFGGEEEDDDEYDEDEPDNPEIDEQQENPEIDAG